MEGMVSFFNMYFQEPAISGAIGITPRTMADVKTCPGHHGRRTDLMTTLCIVVALMRRRAILFDCGQPRAIASAADYVQGNSGPSVLQRLHAGTGDQRTRETVRLALQNVYVNQKPVLYSEDYQLARRDALDIRFADVMRDYAYEEGYVFVGAIW